MKKVLVVANWKSNPKTLAEAKRLFVALKKSAAIAKNVEVIVCPPFPYIPLLKPLGNLKLGGQNCWLSEGPYTGEVSPEILKSIGCQYVILGHSERRRLFYETDEIINKKILKTLKAGLKVLFFLGEQGLVNPTSLEKGFGEIQKQFAAGLAEVGDDQFSDLILVYEPAFAISTAGGKPFLPKEAEKRVSFLRGLLAKRFGASSKKVKILYGGSVDEKNAMSFVKKAEVDGLVVGAVSLDPQALTKTLDMIKE